MVWRATDDSYVKLSAELLYQYHKLEKGLCLTDSTRFFGKDAARAVMHVVTRWRQAGHPRTDRVYVGAIESLRSYRGKLRPLHLPDADGDSVLLDIDVILVDEPLRPELATPVPFRPSADTSDAFERLCQERRSVRAYSPTPVDQGLLERAIGIAQWSPSVCNRQAWRVHIYRDRDQIARLLHLQNGNGGFGHQLSTLLVIAMDSTAFFDATERNQQFIDAGLFSMSLILSLQSLGLASCCLNWSVIPAHDVRAHREGGIPENQRIIMYMAVGHAADGALVPRSPRRELQNVVTTH
ncbi:hypothetical protein ASF43_08600 [Pseudorhodoferax sp. Leaf267]|nr:hypothetical protein ASF43_08600 [Pseudorhodoferax sp. Leaf267]